MVVVDGEEYLTGEEAAGRLGVKPATLYAYVSRGVLRSYRQGIKRRRLYRRADVERLVRMAPGAAGPADAVPAGAAPPADPGPGEASGPRPATRRHAPPIPPAESWLGD
jgi:citrate synthase